MPYINILKLTKYTLAYRDDFTINIFSEKLREFACCREAFFLTGKRAISLDCSNLFVEIKSSQIEMIYLVVLKQLHCVDEISVTNQNC